MILYYGSNTRIEHIDLTKSRPNKDFGLAFYLSADKAQAAEMAEFKADFEGGSPVINAYEFDKPDRVSEYERRNRHRYDFSLDGRTGATYAGGFRQSV